jgi:hypothetical protein
MENALNPYGRKSLGGDFGAYFNVLYCYVERFGVQPNVYEFSVPVALSTVSNLEKLGAERLFLCENERHLSGEVSVIPTESCYRLGEAFVYLHRRDSILDRLHYIGHSDEDEEEEEEDEDEEDEDEEEEIGCRSIACKAQRQGILQQYFHCH